MMTVQNNYIHSLDRIVRPADSLMGKTLPVFQLCGYTGLISAIILTMILSAYLSLSLLIMAGIVLVSISTFYTLAIVTKIITRKEDLVYYHHEIAVILLTSVLLTFLQQPLLPYLDVTILGLGLFLACGRVGCFMAGCCHGRPHRWGALYRQEHADAGLDSCYVGVRLFPVQLVESLWVFGIVIAGSLILLNSYPSGAAFTWYIITYVTGRFFFEFLRGDSERPYYKGFSQAQWISLVHSSVIVCLEFLNVLPFQSWHSVAAALISMTMIFVALRREWGKSDNYQLFKPGHIKEFAESVELVSGLTGDNVPDLNNSVDNIHIASTYLGIQISASQIYSEGGSIYHYSISGHNRNMTDNAARIMGRLIHRLKHSKGSYEFIKGNHGVFHFVYRH